MTGRLRRSVAALLASALVAATLLGHDATPAGAALPSGAGYRVATTTGQVFTFGATNAGSAPPHLAHPIVGLASTPGFGYWLVASDGGVFSFGDAHFHGSTGAIRLTRPIVGMAGTPSGHGYWLVASDGGVFSFGDADFHGSTGAISLVSPIVGMGSTPTGAGYWLAAADGGIFSFGDARFMGSAAGRGASAAPVVGIAVQPALSPYAPRSTGYDISWPQCGGAYPDPPHAIAIVGVNRGHTFSANPCFASEAAWAGAGITLYVNVDALPDDTTSGITGVRRCMVADIACRSYNWGRAAAAHDLALVGAAGVRSSMWWLDVEIGKRWRVDQAANVAAIRGMLDGVRAPGNVVGIYSTSYQWGLITGNRWSPAVPLWVPGADTATEARQYCDASHAFGGGVVWLTQWTITYDHDYACPH
jgi:hypothetical protein